MPPALPSICSSSSQSPRDKVPSGPALPHPGSSLAVRPLQMQSKAMPFLPQAGQLGGHASRPPIHSLHSRSAPHARAGSARGRMSCQVCSLSLPGLWDHTGSVGVSLSTLSSVIRDGEVGGWRESGRWVRTTRLRHQLPAQAPVSWSRVFLGFVQHFYCHMVIALISNSVYAKPHSRRD